MSLTVPNPVLESYYCISQPFPVVFTVQFLLMNSNPFCIECFDLARLIFLELIEACHE